jgi:biotin carboxyl carrier protein
MAPVRVTLVGPGVYRVEHEGRRDIVYVAGRGSDRWVFWNGRVFRDQPPGVAAPHRARGEGGSAAETLEAPMPARVVKILVSDGATVRKGETVVLLEAMKMELPIRAPADLKVVAVRCREGELVQANQPLVELA